jgi:imidazolonepropionase-like amidohydrolase
LLVQAGLTARQALASATTVAAAACALPDVGKLSAGYAADLIAVRGNPVDDIGAVRRIFAVVSAGQRIWPRQHAGESQP